MSGISKLAVDKIENRIIRGESNFTHLDVRFLLDEVRSLRNRGTLIHEEEREWVSVAERLPSVADNTFPSSPYAFYMFAENDWEIIANQYYCAIGVGETIIYEVAIFRFISQKWEIDGGKVLYWYELPPPPAIGTDISSIESTEY